MKLKPMNGKIIVREIKNTEKKTGSGIIIPDVVSDNKIMVEVMEVSADAGTEHLGKGDKAFITKYCGDKVEIEGEEVLIIEAGDVLAKII